MFQVQASGADEGERGGRRAAAGGFSAGLDRGEGLTFSWTEGWDRWVMGLFSFSFLVWTSLFFYACLFPLGLCFCWVEV